LRNTRVPARHALHHGHDIHTADLDLMSFSQGHDPFSFFLLAPAELFPCSPCLVFGYLQLAFHFRQELV
jgi:hypothetical protein